MTVHPWVALQLLVLSWWAVSEWSVRRGDPRGSSFLRGIMVFSILALFVPFPTPGVERLVPLQSGTGFDAVRRTAATLEPLVEPMSSGLSRFSALIAVAVLALLGAQVASRRYRLARAQVLHRVGRVTLAVHPDVESPCTQGILRPWILLDPKTCADPSERDLAVRHEATHIRRGDLLFAWLSALVVAISAINPFAWRLARNLAELDEHAVDHSLVATRGVSPRRYGRLLLSNATSPALVETRPGLSHTTLHRRLHMLAKRPASRFASWIVVATLVTTVAWLLPTRPAVARPEVSANHRVDRPDHDLVQEALDRLTVTPKGRAFVKSALERRPDHHDYIQRRLAKAGLPSELEAVAFIESGYDDQLQTGDLKGGPMGAGLWMFIPRTAREYGLEVSADLDERLDRDRETDAAIALLSDLHDRYGDWGLALAAYNQGPTHVDRAIASSGSRDVTTLVEAGALNRYVPMVWAAMAILEDQ